ncbi:MAG TPA: circularly permuted type 2 ATP-grasp protein [Acidimicrobiales bacterium]|nr:circularly permuted type 2 ATP-grasp protein [Acidimicrobiales bacterium]
MGDLLDGYRSTTWDEMCQADGTPRAACASLHEALQALSDDDFERRCVARDRAFRDQGITFSLSGEERPFPLDLVPRILAAAEWAVLEAGVAQRVLALEAFLDDIYSAGRILADGVVPTALVTSSTHFHRPAVGVSPANGVRIHVAGIDIVRDGDGTLRVLEDNVRTPSGISYVVENRRTMSRVFPELFASHRVRPVNSYPARLLEALRAAAPTRSGDPTVVVLTPGIYNSAYFEHTFLARQMGVELVEGRDLVCRNNTVFMRSTTGEQRVDVVYRRVDDDFLDPLHFRTDARLGCPGILNAARAGKVTIANAVGNGVADDKLMYTYVPEMIDYYFGDKPILPNVPTYRLCEPDQLEVALDRLDRLVVKPVDASGGRGLLIGPAASDEDLAKARAAILANPRGWIAQETVQLSTAPTWVGRRLVARHVDLRPFAVNDGERVWVVPGGLTRVALPAGSLVVNSSQGGGSKDTWVLADETDRVARSRQPDGGARDVPEGEPPAGPRPDPGPIVAQAAQQQQAGPTC